MPVGARFQRARLVGARLVGSASGCASLVDPRLERPPRLLIRRFPTSVNGSSRIWDDPLADDRLLGSFAAWSEGRSDGVDESVEVLVGDRHRQGEVAARRDVVAGVEQLVEQ